MSTTAQIGEDLAELTTNIAEIRASLRVMVWMSGFTLAIVVVLTWRAFQ